MVAKRMVMPRSSAAATLAFTACVVTLLAGQVHTTVLAKPFRVDTPTSLATTLGEIDLTEADFAPKAGEAGITADVIIADNDGANKYACSPLDPSVDYTGKIVIAYRGACMFSTKAINIAAVGGLACLVNNSDDNLITMITAPFHYGGTLLQSLGAAHTIPCPCSFIHSHQHIPGSMSFVCLMADVLTHFTYIELTELTIVHSNRCGDNPDADDQADLVHN